MFYCISSLFIALSNAFARGTGHIGIYSGANFFTSMTIIFLNLLLILGFNQGFYALIISACTANFSASFFVFIKLKFWNYIDIKNWNNDMLRKMLMYSIPLVPNTISWSIINVSDRLVIMNFLGASANGLYSIAYKFPNLMSTFYNFFNIAWRETSAKLVRDNEMKDFDIIYRRVRMTFFVITIMLLATIRYVYPFFINVQYQESIVYVPILVISTYYLSLSAFYGGIFSAYKNTKMLGMSSIYAAVINLVIDFFFVRFIGVYAAAISTLVSSIFIYLYRKYRLKKFYNAYKKNDIGILVVFCMLLVLFYLNIPLLNLVEVVLVVVSSLIFNIDTIGMFISKIRRDKH